jgi:uncharacterized protein (TIGR00270 family)
MACDLCSKKGSTQKTRIEGIVYDACSECAQLGQKVETATMPSKKRSRRNPDENVGIKPNVASILRKARGSTPHEEFAKRLSVKESDVHAWETGHRTPTIATARKLQKQLHVNLLTDYEQSGDASQFSKKEDGGALTIGDLLKKK